MRIGESAVVEQRAKRPNLRVQAPTHCSPVQSPQQPSLLAPEGKINCNTSVSEDSEREEIVFFSFLRAGGGDLKIIISKQLFKEVSQPALAPVRRRKNRVGCSVQTAGPLADVEKKARMLRSMYTANTG